MTKKIADNGPRCARCGDPKTTRAVLVTWSNGERKILRYCASCRDNASVGRELKEKAAQA